MFLYISISLPTTNVFDLYNIHIMYNYSEIIDVPSMIRKLHLQMIDFKYTDAIFTYIYLHMLHNIRFQLYLFCTQYFLPRSYSFFLIAIGQLFLEVVSFNYIWYIAYI